MTFQEFMDHIAHLDVQRRGDHYVTNCPAHNDNTPSLKIQEGDTCVLLTCWSQKCSLGDIAAGFGLDVQDLFYERRNGKVDVQKRLAAWYDYLDEDKSFLFRVDRLEWVTPDGKKHKSFLQKHVENGDWVYNLNGVKRVPYRLPRLLKAVRLGRTVYFVEGEKDVDAWTYQGYYSTTFIGGAKKFLPRYVKYFIGLKKLVIVRDKDSVGHEHAEIVRDAFEGVIPSIEVCEAASGKDSFDHLAAGLGPYDLIRVE